MEILGVRAAMRAGAEIQALAAQTESAQKFFDAAKENLPQALNQRDTPYRDCRTEAD